MQSHPGLSLSVKSTHHWRIPGIAADAALAAVGSPLATEPPAVQLVVVVVGRSVEAVPDAWETESEGDSGFLLLHGGPCQVGRQKESLDGLISMHCITFPVPNWSIAREGQRLLLDPMVGAF